MPTKSLPDPEKGTTWREDSEGVSILSRIDHVSSSKQSGSGWTFRSSVVEDSGYTGETVDRNQQSGDIFGRDTAISAEEGGLYEEILGWWQGKVLSVGSKMFEAELRDLEGRESVAHIEKKSTGHAQQGDIREGARFIYSVSRVEQIDGARTLSSIQFLPAYIHAEGDDEFVKSRIRSLYEENGDLP